MGILGTIVKSAISVGQKLEIESEPAISLQKDSYNHFSKQLKIQLLVSIMDLKKS